MKNVLFSVSFIVSLFMYSGVALAADLNGSIDMASVLQVAKSGCCKVRKSPQHPWAKSNQNFDQCEEANNKDRDSIYQSKGLYWWDRSC